MRNRYGGPCYRCGVWCAPGEGHFERFQSGWRVQHAACAIAYRGTTDPDRDADRLVQLERRALGTGETAQRARKLLRDRALKDRSKADKTKADEVAE